jgi:pyridoxamine 5'-phosphate oxidase
MIAIEQAFDLQRQHTPDFTNPLALLVHCHKKIENQLCTLEQVAEKVIDGTLDDRLSAFFAIDMARAHFAGPLVKHTEDEEVSLFPRLRARGGRAVGEVLAALDELETEHRMLEQLHREFEALAADIHRDCSCQTRKIEQLDALVAALCELYRPHMQIENELVFPAAARLLLPSDIHAIGEEMRARRRLTLQKLVRS